MTLQCDVQWQEFYTSQALNRQDHMIIPVGVYHGFAVEAYSSDKVQVKPGKAVVYCNGYAVAVTSDGDEIVTIPTGQHVLQLEVDYTPGQATTARLTTATSVADNAVAIAAFDFSDYPVDPAAATQYGGALPDLGNQLVKRDHEGVAAGARFSHEDATTATDFLRVMVMEAETGHVRPATLDDTKRVLGIGKANTIYMDVRSQGSLSQSQALSLALATQPGGTIPPGTFICVAWQYSQTVNYGNSSGTTWHSARGIWMHILNYGIVKIAA